MSLTVLYVVAAGRPDQPGGYAPFVEFLRDLTFDPFLDIFVDLLPSLFLDEATILIYATSDPQSGCGPSAQIEVLGGAFNSAGDLDVVGQPER